MPRTTDGPQWAQELVAEISAEFHPELPTPKLTWNQSRRVGYRRLSSGRAGSYEQSPRARIHVTAGNDRTDARMAVLHELAHWTLPSGCRHGPEWAARAFDLYARHDLIDYAIHWERREQSAFHALARERVPARYDADGALAEPCFGCKCNHAAYEVRISSAKDRRRILKSAARPHASPAMAIERKQRFLRYTRKYRVQDEWLRYNAWDPSVQYELDHQQLYTAFYNRRMGELNEMDYGLHEWFEARDRAAAVA